MLQCRINSCLHKSSYANIHGRRIWYVPCESCFTSQCRFSFGKVSSSGITLARTFLMPIFLKSICSAAAAAGVCLMTNSAACSAALLSALSRMRTLNSADSRSVLSGEVSFLFLSFLSVIRCSHSSVGPSRKIPGMLYTSVPVDTGTLFGWIDSTNLCVRDWIREGIKEKDSWATNPVRTMRWIFGST